MLNLFKESSHLNSEILKREIAMCQVVADSEEFNKLIAYYEEHFMEVKYDDYNVTVGDYFYGHCQRLVDRFGENLNCLCDRLKFTDYFDRSVIERPLPVSRSQIESLGNKISREEKFQLLLHDTMWASRVFGELMMVKKLAQFAL